MGKDSKTQPAKKGSNITSPFKDAIYKKKGD